VAQQHPTHKTVRLSIVEFTRSHYDNRNPSGVLTMQAAELVRDYISAWNRRDAAGIVNLLTHNGFYFDVPLNKKLSGEPLVQYLANDFRQRKLRYDLVGEILIGTFSIAFQYRTRDADKSADSGPELSGAEFLTVRGDKVTGIEDYYKFPSDMEPQDVSHTGERASSQNQYRKSGLRKEQVDTYKQRLLNLMEAEQLYLAADLTLPELAGRMHCSINHLSQVINGEFHLSFYEFLNRYRIEYAKELLSRESRGRDSVAQVAERAGFKSNSAFYAAFKRSCRHTPSAYRRMNCKG
jgi:AraC-like DNA-binding protein